ncbi:MAG: hypothetical protein LBJ62_01145 [Bifidobacteriaceae bacterium]|jgi:hypothetical protein|nr:hypothetical protein [Bifidobacteriaceae bacterium]
MALFSSKSAGATWSDAVAHLKAQYKYKELPDGEFKLIFDLGDNRDQLVFVAKAGNEKAGDWVSITSPIGDFAVLIPQMSSLLNECDNKICGAVVAQGDVVLLRHSFPVASFTPEVFDWALQVITFTADQLEAKFAGGNKY